MVNHRLCALRHLFRRLEQKDHGSFQCFPVLRQQFRRAVQSHRVKIMSAAVHYAIDTRHDALMPGFLLCNRINICAKRHSPTGQSAAKHSHNTGFHAQIYNFQSEGCEFFFHNRSRASLFKTKFRATMYVVFQALEFTLQRFCLLHQ